MRNPVVNLPLKAGIFSTIVVYTNNWMRTAKKIVVAVIGGTVLLLGIAMVILPGPAFIVIPVGLAILATEFAWAKHWLKKAKDKFQRKKKGEPGFEQPSNL